MTTAPLRERAAWKALEAHHRAIEGRHLRDLFATNALIRRYRRSRPER